MRAKVWECALALLFCATGSAEAEDAGNGYHAMAPLSGVSIDARD